MRREHDGTFRKAYSARTVKATQSDLHSVIKELPPSYFKRVKARGRHSLQETVSGMRTIIGNMRVRRRTDATRKGLSRRTLILMLALLALALAGAAACLLFR